MQAKKPQQNFKICTQCGVKKPLDAFHFASKSKNLRQAKCKCCVLEYVKKYTEKNSAVIREKNRLRYQKSSQEKINGKVTDLYKTCPNCKTEKYYKDFGLKVGRSGSETKSIRFMCISCEKERKKDWYLGNKAEILQKRKSMTPEQRQLATERTKIWRAANPDVVVKHRSSSHQLRIERLAQQADGTLTRSATKALFDAAKTCPDCNRMFSSIIKKSLDHIKPISKGGLHSITNVRICCLACNLKKGANDC